MNLGTQIKSFRKRLNISQSQLEDRSGVKQHYISRLESGKLKNPSLNTLRKIANGLGVPLESLLEQDATTHSFEDLLYKSVEMEQKIDLIKENMSRLLFLLEKIENEELLQNQEKQAAKNQNSLMAAEEFMIYPQSTSANSQVTNS